MQNGAAVAPSTAGVALASAAVTGAGALRPGSKSASSLISHHSQQSCETLPKKVQDKVPHNRHQFKSMNPYDLNVQMSN